MMRRAKVSVPSKCVIEKLLRDGEVYIYNRFKRRFSKVYIVQGDKKYLCRLEFVAEVCSEDDLRKYLEKSGYNDFKKWVSDIKFMTGGVFPSRGYVFRLIYEGEEDV